MCLFKCISKIGIVGVNAMQPDWCMLNIDSGNGLVLSGNKPLPEPMVTKFYKNIIMVSLGKNGLMFDGLIFAD